jgi:hypothetical protein
MGYCHTFVSWVKRHNLTESKVRRDIETAIFLARSHMFEKTRSRLTSLNQSRQAWALRMKTLSRVKSSRYMWPVQATRWRDTGAITSGMCVSHACSQIPNTLSVTALISEKDISDKGRDARTGLNLIPGRTVLSFKASPRWRKLLIRCRRRNSFWFPVPSC